MALPIQHEDGVVVNALHHEPKSLLRLEQFLFRPLPIGDVAHGGHDHRDLLGHHGAERDVGRELAAVLAPEPDVQVRAH
jgi:hypothetical protein